MKNMKCTSCGAPLKIQGSITTFTCEYCGAKLVVAKVQEQMLAQLPKLERAFILLEDGEFTKADQLLEDFLNTAPKNAKAYVGKLMATLQVKEESDLANHKQPLEEYSAYNRAVSYADDSYRSVLLGYNQAVKNRIEQARRPAHPHPPTPQPVPPAPFVPAPDQKKKNTQFAVWMSGLGIFLIVALLVYTSSCLAFVQPILAVSTPSSRATKATVQTVVSSSVPLPLPAEPMAEFPCQPQDLFNTLNQMQKLEKIYYMDEEQYTVYASGASLSHERMRILAYGSPQSGQLKAFLFKRDYSPYINDAATVERMVVAAMRQCGLPEQIEDKQIRTTLREASDNAVRELGQMRIVIRPDEEGESIIVYPDGTDLDALLLPWRVNWPENVFLGNQERLETFKAYIEKYDFQSAKALLETFIAEYNPLSTDASHQYLEKLSVEGLADALAKCDVTIDPVEGDVRVAYRGVSEINQNNHIMASIKNKSVEYHVGFISPTWINFSRISINVGEGKNITSSWNTWTPTRDIVPGGVKEYVYTTLNAEEVSRIVNAENPVIRFADEKNQKQLDYNITPAEQDCLHSISLIKKIRSQISFHSWETYYA